MRRDCPASFHFSNKLCTAKRRSPGLSSSFSFIFFSFSRRSWIIAGRKRRKRTIRRKRDAKERLRGRKEGRKEGSEHEEGVPGEVSRGRGAISRLSIMEPVRSYREPAAGEELAFHPTNLS